MPKLIQKLRLHKKSLFNYGTYALIFVIFVYIFFDSNYCQTSLVAFSSSNKSPVIHRDKISWGYTLLSPMNSFDDLKEKGKVYLVDLYGKPVQTWSTQYQAFNAAIKKNGNLVVTLVKPDKNSNYPAGGRTGIIQELDWNGEILWEYQNNMLHHDFDILPNGNIAALIWDEIPKEIAQKIKGGVKGTEFKGNIFADAIIEINKQGQIDWTWHAFEHLDLNQDSLSPLDPRAEWTHSNSIQYLDKNPINGQAAYLISMRDIDTVAIVGKNTGQIIWRSKPGLLAHQHDATMLSNGNILVFDNGLYRKPKPRPRLGSKVVEVNPQKNQVVWEFNGGKTGIEQVNFFEPIISGAQRLENGNTLIIEGVSGHLFEITKDKQLVWDFINPYTSYTTGVFPNNSIFKARRYSIDEIDWPERLPHPMPLTSQICQKLRF